MNNTTYSLKHNYPSALLSRRHYFAQAGNRKKRNALSIADEKILEVVTTEIN
jgi:hypothetical protein